MLPPSLVLKEAFKEQKGQCSAEQAVGLAKTCLLPVNEVEMWWDHLKTVSDNRREGAAKAAKTRRKKAGEAQTVFCRVCRDPYVEYTKEVERWIQCDVCQGWAHFVCASLDEEPENFTCQYCV